VTTRDSAQADGIDGLAPTFGFEVVLPPRVGEFEFGGRRLRLDVAFERAQSHDSQSRDCGGKAPQIATAPGLVAELGRAPKRLSSLLFNVACALLAVIIVGMLLLSSASHPTVSGHTEPAGPRIAPDVEATAPLLSIKNRDFSAGATDGQIVWRQPQRGRSK